MSAIGPLLSSLQQALCRGRTHHRPSVTLPVRSRVIAKNSIAWLGQKLPNLGANDPIFCAASSAMRRLGAPVASPSVLTASTIRSQGTKALVKTLVARDRRSPSTTRRMSRIAKGSYCRARCCQKQALAQIAKSGGLRFRCSRARKRESCGRGGRQSWRVLTRTRLRYAQPH